MNRHKEPSKHSNYLTQSCKLFSTGVIVTAIISALLGCAPQPESMFEQQAEAEAASEIGINQTIELDETKQIVTATAADGVENLQALSINISKNQAIARQSECNPQQTTCQYLELNTLIFTPAQPWLATIMWQTVTRVLSPETPFTSQKQVAKDSVSALLKQIEFSSAGVSSQPLYQRLDTQLILNEHVAEVEGKTVSNVITGYILVESTQHRNETHSDSRQQWHLDYVMLDMQKKLQLTLEDVLLPEISVKALLPAFQAAKNEWLSTQAAAPPYLTKWPLSLSKQWYIDQEGLHMVYQLGEFPNTELNVLDLVVPFDQLQGIIKPSYIVSSSVGMT